MKALLLIAVAALPNGPTDVQATLGDCGPAPPLPAVTDLVAVQLTDTEWGSHVTAWVPDPDTCWKLGREVFKGYQNDADTPQIHEPTPLKDEPVHDP